MKLQLVLQEEGQSHELLATRISIEDGSDYFKGTELWIWGFIMASGRALIKFLWEREWEKRMRGKRRNGS